MSIDTRAFRQTVGQFVTGVTVIAAEIDGAVRAMTANSFTSLSLDPPLVLFCVGKTAHLGQLIHSASGFSVNILSRSSSTSRPISRAAWKEETPPPFTFETWDGGPRLSRIRRRARVLDRDHLRRRRPLDRDRQGDRALSG